MKTKKEDISTDHITIENLPDYELDNNTRKIIEAHGEVSFLKKIGRLIRKHARINVDFTTGQVTLTIAGIIIINENYKK